jgi:hypothetical protein
MGISARLFAACELSMLLCCESPLLHTDEVSVFAVNVMLLSVNVWLSPLLLDAVELDEYFGIFLRQSF